MTLVLDRTIDLITDPTDQQLEETQNLPNTSSNAVAEALAKWAVELFGPYILEGKITAENVNYLTQVIATDFGGVEYICSSIETANAAVILSDLPEDQQSFVAPKNTKSNSELINQVFNTLFFDPKYSDILFPLSSQENNMHRFGYKNFKDRLLKLDGGKLVPEVLFDIIEQIMRDPITGIYGEIRTRIQNEKWLEKGSNYLPFDYRQNISTVDIANFYITGVASQVFHQAWSEFQKANPRRDADPHSFPNS